MARKWVCFDALFMEAILVHARVRGAARCPVNPKKAPLVQFVAASAT
jgi:hypothetical protein